VARAVQTSLPRGWQVACAGADGHGDSIGDAVSRLVGLGGQRLVVVPLHPQFDADLTGAALDRLYSAMSTEEIDLHLEVRSSWCDEEAYVEALAEQTHLAAHCVGIMPWEGRLVIVGAKTESTHCVRQAVRTAELIARRVGWPRARAGVCLGDEVTWLAEDTCAEGPVLVCPLSALDDDALNLRDLAAALGVESAELTVVPGLERSGMLPKVLGCLIRRGRHAVRNHDPRPPLFGSVEIRSNAAAQLAELVMIGASVKGVLGRGEGPGVAYCTAEDFKSLKRPHTEALELLRKARGEAHLSDGWLWNTCSRFELYGWVGNESGPERLERMFRGESPAPMNILRGREALRHALRTAAGLNSSLAGDAEVVDQLRSCLRASEYAGVAGESARWLSEELATSAERVRSETGWGRFAHRYCRVVIDRLRDRLPVGHDWKVLVIGGSTTSASVIETMTGSLGIDPSRITLVYRGQRSGALMKRLAEATTGGAVLQVESYEDPAVLRAVGEADVIFLAADQREAILTGAQLAASRDLSVRPMLLIDFNTFGSVDGAAHVRGVRLIGPADLEAEVTAFNRAVISQPQFAVARAEAERWIARRVNDLIGEVSR
jgi:glutamyl-tRNA reductase